MNESWSESQRRHFENELPAYQDLYGSDNAFHRAMTATLMGFARPAAGERVMDVGCGLGRATLPLLRAGCEVTGLDISGSSLDRLSARVRELGLADRFHPVCQAAEQIAFGDRFDLVVGRGILHHLERPAGVLARIRTALVAGGRVVFMDPNPLNPAWLPFILVHPTLRWSVERHVFRGTPRRSRALLRAAGFAGVEHAFTGLVPPPLWERFSGSGGLERALASVPGLRMLGLYLMVRGRKPGG